MERRLASIHTRSNRALFVCLLAVGATGCGPIDLVNPYEAEVLAKVRAGSHELVPTAEIAELRARGAVGKYEIFTRGARTYRFDTTNGGVCLLLAPDSDWKDSAAQQISCMR